MLHVLYSTNTNVTYALGYCFMRSANEEDLLWILKIYVENAIIINPSVIVTDADEVPMNACAKFFPLHTISCVTGTYNPTSRLII